MPSTFKLVKFNRDAKLIVIKTEDKKSTVKKLGAKISQLSLLNLKLIKIFNRGVEVYPAGDSATFCTNLWSCQFLNTADCSQEQIVQLLQNFNFASFDFIEIENLCALDGKAS